MPFSEAILVVEFHPDHGHICQLKVGNCDDQTAKRAALLALPDSHGTTSKNGSSLVELCYAFRLRIDETPLCNASSLDHDYLFGASLFRTRKDSKAKRGYIQRAVVVLTRRPYLSLLKATVKLIGLAYFAADGAFASVPGPINGIEEKKVLQAILETSWAEISSWPPFLASYSLRLRLLGLSLNFDVPFTGVAGYQAGSASALAIHEADAIAPTEAELESHQLAQRKGILSLDPSTGALMVRQTTTATPVSASSEHAVDFSAANASRMLAPPHLSTPASSPGGPGSGPRKASRSSSGANPASLLGIKEVFARKRMATPGLFQDVGLFSVFRSLCGQLWTLWELVITGQQILVIGSSPEATSDTVLALVSLISPLDATVCDYRPFFSLYDRDSSEVIRMMDAQTGDNKGGSNLMRTPKSTTAAALLPPPSPLLRGAGQAHQSLQTLTAGTSSVVGSPSRSPVLAATASASGSTGGATPSAEAGITSTTMRKPNPVLVAGAALANDNKDDDDKNSVSSLSFANFVRGSPLASSTSFFGGSSNTSNAASLGNVVVKDSRRNLGAGTPIPFALPPQAPPPSPSFSPLPSPAPTGASVSSARGGGGAGVAMAAGLRTPQNAASSSSSSSLRRASLPSTPTPSPAAVATTTNTQLLLGSTNPFFLKSLSSFPNALFLPSSSSSGGSHAHALPSVLTSNAGGGSSGSGSVNATLALSSALGEETAHALLARAQQAQAQATSVPTPTTTTAVTSLVIPPASGPSSSALASSPVSHYTESEVRSQLKVISATTPLTDVNPGDDASNSSGSSDGGSQKQKASGSKGTLVCRKAPFLSPDFTVLSQLLRVKPGDENGRQMRLVPPGSAVVTSSAPPSPGEAQHHDRRSAPPSPPPATTESATSKPRSGNGSGEKKGGRFSLTLPAFSANTEGEKKGDDNDGGAVAVGVSGGDSSDRQMSTGDRPSSVVPSTGRSDVVDGDVEVLTPQALETTTAASTAAASSVRSVSAPRRKPFFRFSSSSSSSSTARSAGESSTATDDEDAEAAAAELAEETQASVAAATFRFAAEEDKDEDNTVGGVSLSVPASPVAALVAARPINQGAGDDGSSGKSSSTSTSTAFHAPKPTPAGVGVAAPLVPPPTPSVATTVGFGDPSKGDVPSTLINNALLRTVFRGLTLGLLKEFSHYFKPQQLVQQPEGGGGQPKTPSAAAGLGLLSSPLSALLSPSVASPAPTTTTPAAAPTLSTNLSLEMSKGTAITTDPNKARQQLYGAGVGGTQHLERSTSSFSVTGLASANTANSTPEGTTSSNTPTPVGTPVPLPAASPGFGGKPPSGANAASKPPNATAASSSSPFNATATASGPSGSVLSFGPYEDLASLLLPQFDEKKFLDGLAAKGGPKHKKLRSCSRWRELFSAFIAGPHFRPWFQARRKEASRQFFEHAKALRLAMPDAELERIIGAGTTSLLITSAEVERREKACIDLQGKIVASFVREQAWLREAGNEELLATMRRHLSHAEKMIKNTELRATLHAAALRACDLIAEPAQGSAI
jgi:Transport protein Avl9